MSRRSRRIGFALRDLLVVLIVVIALLAIILPVIRSANDGANRNHCFCRVRQLALAMHNYVSGNRCYPLVSFNTPPFADPARDCRPGDASGGSSTAGYSWLVALLPHIEEGGLYKAIVTNSANFSVKTGPFTPSIVNAQSSSQHASCVQLFTLVCPSWHGDGYTNSNTPIDIGPAGGAPQSYGAPEYESVDSTTPGAGPGAFRGKVAITNYKVMVGTHMSGGVPVENGGIILTGAKGLTEADFKDGISHTILLSETKESSYASWYDGTLNWLVGNDPNKPPPGANGQPPWKGASLSINRGFDPAVEGSVPYLKRELTANAPRHDVWWGASSDHSGGMVAHGYCDGHTFGVTDQCDPETYLSLISRSGDEPIDDTKIQ